MSAEDADPRMRDDQLQSAPPFRSAAAEAIEPHPLAPAGPHNLSRAEDAEDLESEDSAAACGRGTRTEEENLFAASRRGVRARSGDLSAASGRGARSASDDFTAAHGRGTQAEVASLSAASGRGVWSYSYNKGGVCSKDGRLKGGVGKVKHHHGVLNLNVDSARPLTLALSLRTLTREPVRT